MDIHNAIKHIRQHGCACKQIERVLEQLFHFSASRFSKADVIFTPHAVLLDARDGQHVLCSRFFEQRV